MACFAKEMDMHLCVSIPIGSIYQTDLVVQNCTITIQDRVFFADLVVLSIQG